MDAWNTKTRFLLGVKVAYFEALVVSFRDLYTFLLLVVFFSPDISHICRFFFADSVRIWDIFFKAYLFFQVTESDGL